MDNKVIVFKLLEAIETDENRETYISKGQWAGYPFAISNEIAVVGFPGDGEVYVAKKLWNGWEIIQELDPPFIGASVCRFGFAVAINAEADYIAVTAPYHMGGAGAVFVFERGHRLRWRFLMKTSFTRGPFAREGDRLGTSVAFSPDSRYLAVGASFSNGGVGSVVLFDNERGLTGLDPCRELFTVLPTMRSEERHHYGRRVAWKDENTLLVYEVNRKTGLLEEPTATRPPFRFRPPSDMVVPNSFSAVY